MDHRKEHWIVRLYRAALSCFPEGYRREYTDELLYAVRMAADEAEAQGWVSPLRLAWRELRDLPLAIFRAHLRERSVQMNLQPGAHLPEGPIRSWQFGAVFLPFLLLLVFPLNQWAFNTKGMPWLLPALCLPFLGLLVVVWFAGLLREFPVWTLPALGVVFFFVSALLKAIAITVVFTAVFLPVYGKWGWPDGIPLAESIGTTLLVQLVFLVIVAAVVAGLLRATPRLQVRVRQEWTLLSFLLYSIAIISTVLWGDEYHGVEGYQVASLLVLAFGAGLYLVAPRRWQRILALVIPAVLAPMVMSVGLYQAFPAQTWANPANPPYFLPESVSTVRWWEALQPVLSFSPLPILLLLAALVPRLPWNGKTEQGSSPALNPPVQGSE